MSYVDEKVFGRVARICHHTQAVADDGAVAVGNAQLHPLSIDLAERRLQGRLRRRHLGAAAHRQLADVERLLLVATGVVFDAQLIRRRCAEIQFFHRGIRIFDPDDLAVAPFF